MSHVDDIRFKCISCSPTHIFCCHIKNIPQGEGVSVECFVHDEGHPPAEIVLNHEKHARSMDELGDGTAVEV